MSRQPTYTNGLKLSQMYHMVGLAEEMHFGRAAAKLGIAQPAFSQSIKRLETNLGLILVNRTHHSVSLTPAGEAFVREARSVLRGVELTQTAAQRAAKGEVDTLRVGFSEAAMFRLLPAILKGFRQREPGVKLQFLEQTSSPAIVTNLQQNNLDVGFFLPRRVSTEGLETRVVESARLLACLSASSPLSQRKEIHLIDLADEPFIMYPPEVQPMIDDAILSACLRAGFKPRIEQQTLRSLSMLSLVIAGLGVAFVPETARSSHFEGLAYIPVVDMPDLRRELHIGWRPENLSTALSSLLDLTFALGLSDSPDTP